jgi:hypothetical protein
MGAVLCNECSAVATVLCYVVCAMLCLLCMLCNGMLCYAMLFCEVMRCAPVLLYASKKINGCIKYINLFIISYNLNFNM